jgi:hypothetical protein
MQPGGLLEHILGKSHARPDVLELIQTALALGKLDRVDRTHRRRGHDVWPEPGVVQAAQGSDFERSAGTPTTQHKPLRHRHQPDADAVRARHSPLASTAQQALAKTSIPTDVHSAAPLPPSGSTRKIASIHSRQTSVSSASAAAATPRADSAQKRARTRRPPRSPRIDHRRTTWRACRITPAAALHRKLLSERPSLCLLLPLYRSPSVSHLLWPRRDTPAMSRLEFVAALVGSLAWPAAAARH